VVRLFEPRNAPNNAVFQYRDGWRLAERLLTATSLPEREAIVRIAAIAAFVLCAVALAFHSTAKSATGMSAMQYYVGSWTCRGGNVSKPPVHATLRLTLANDILNEWVTVPVQTGMTTAINESILTAYDAKNNRYVSVDLHNNARWGVTYATLDGNTETDVDHATWDGKLGHGVVDRVNNSTFTVTAYPTLTSTKADFKATCHRS
jgi:hypothetical protein